MANCPECGKLLKKDEKKCSKCGHRIEESAFKKLIDKIVDYYKKEGSREKTLIIAVVVLIIAGVGIFFALRGDGSDKIDVIELPTNSVSSGVTSGDTTTTDTSNNGVVDFDTLLPERDYSKADEEVDIPIEDDYFVAGIFELRGNYKENDYLGQTISIEGLYSEFIPEGQNVVYHNVYRLAESEDPESEPQNIGIEVVWDGEYPNEGDWIKVIGVLRAYEENGHAYLTLDALSVEVLETPGSTYVYY